MDVLKAIESLEHFISGQGFAVAFGVVVVGCCIKWMPGFLDSMNRIAKSSEQFVVELKEVRMELKEVRMELKPIKGGLADVESAVSGLQAEFKELKEQHR